MNFYIPSTIKTLVYSTSVHHIDFLFLWILVDIFILTFAIKTNQFLHFFLNYIFWNNVLSTLSNRFTWETTLYLRNLRSYWIISDPVNFAEKIEKALLQIGLSHQDKFAMQFWFNQLCHKNCVIEKTTIYIVNSNYYIEKIMAQYNFL